MPHVVLLKRRCFLCLFAAEIGINLIAEFDMHLLGGAGRKTTPRGGSGPFATGIKTSHIIFTMSGSTLATLSVSFGIVVLLSKIIESGLDEQGDQFIKAVINAFRPFLFLFFPIYETFL